MEGRLDMAAKKQLTNKFKAEYAKGTKKQKGEVLDRLEAVGMGRSTARRLLTQAVAATPREPAKRGRRPRYGRDAQMLLERLWLLMGMPCGPYMKAMFAQWIPALQANGELDRVDDAALGQVLSMSPATIDRRLRKLKAAGAPKGMSLTRAAVETAIPLFPFPVTCFDSDNGTEFINDELIDWLQQRDIEQTRSRPYRKNDQATVESRNNHVVRKYASYWRYDTQEQRDLLNRLWTLTHALLNLFTPTRKPVRWEQSRDGRRKTIYDEPRTPWARVLEHDAADRARGGQGYVDEATRGRIETIIASTNPAQLGRDIAALQDRLEHISRDRSEALARRNGLDMGYLGQAIERMRADAAQDKQ